MSERNGDARWGFFRRGVQSTLEHAGVRRLSALKTMEAAFQKERQRLLETRPKIFVGMPAYSKTGNWDEAWHGFIVRPTDEENLSVIQSKFSNSLLSRSFNHLYAHALGARTSQGVTHFAMLHSDVAPEANWVDLLWEEIETLQADIVSAVMPIKSALGLTVVAFDRPDPWMPRRLTMTEIMRLPETFGCQATVDMGLNPEGHRLMVGTGCWICDLRKPWVDVTDENGHLKCYFTIRDCIRRNPDGSYFVGVQSEDWNFSRMVQDVDPTAKVLATRKVTLNHMGEGAYPNDRAWGQWKHDRDILGEELLEGPGEMPEEVTDELATV
ncbi:MAG: hypothetical protein ACYTA5_21715 [Planctomycetota bacterium]|jgi:hypothetical protein